MMKETIGESASSVWKSTARLARMVLVLLSYAPVGERGKESDQNFTNCYFIANVGSTLSINFMP